MFELSSETRITELEAESPAMMKALLSTGIFHEGDNPELTIDQLCWNFGLNPLIILNTLVRAHGHPRRRRISMSANWMA